MEKITTTTRAGLALEYQLSSNICIWSGLTPAQRMAFFVEAADDIEETGSYEIKKTYTWNRVPVMISRAQIGYEVAA
jgi:hypothetical protein